MGLPSPEPRPEPPNGPSDTGALRVVADLNRCQGYAQCCYAAPEHFVLHGHEILFSDPAPPA
ncbi:ferredoxin, partial [Methylobacterium sp. A54F]